ncbi:MAG: hypothetical protein ACOCP8_00725 [archaeon]
MKNKLYEYLLKNGRNMTKEEAKDYQKSIQKLYKPTGRNIFDIIEDEKIKNK